MKILSGSQIREADKQTMIRQEISSDKLMERAAAAFVRAFVQLYDDEKRPVYVLCGPGNNGGDGLAISRMLLDHQYKVQAYVVAENDKRSDDFKINYERLEKFQQIPTISHAKGFPVMEEGAILIDALFGSGLSRPLEGLFAEVVKVINEAEAEVVAVDVPSGLFLDKPIEKDNPIVRADFVLTFQLPKLAFMLPENGKYIHQWRLLNIGLDEEFIRNADTSYTFVDVPLIRALYHKRSKWSNKGDFGKVLLITGSKGKMGAGVLCARACLRSGVGLLTVHVPAVGYTIIQSAVPEAMAITDTDVEEFTSPPGLENFSVLGMGPGLGTSETTRNAFAKLLDEIKTPAVFDADALNLLSMDKGLLQKLPKQTILTPHPKEFERLAGSWENDYQRLQKQRDFAQKYEVVLVLKGAHTSIAAPNGQVYFNSTGNPGLATGGTGDVLTGILTGLLGQEYKPVDAAILGVFLHGLAGDLAAEALGEEALIASDLIDFLPEAYKKLQQPGFTLRAQTF